MKPRHGIVALLWFTLVTGFSQTDDRLLSPEVHSDRTATFRIDAPNASSVALVGDWMGGEVAPMTRNTNGTWSITVGPLNPGLAIYMFDVDGMRVVDPINPLVKLRAHTTASLVDVPGNPPELWQIRDVPHGEVAIVRAKSEVTQDTRAYRVYTPPGYYASGNNKEYPVLFLLHGNNGTEADWTEVGAANLIFDNLIAEGQAEPMIVVMPWGHAVPYFASRENNQPLMERYILEELIPQVEKRYRVKSGPKNRAIVGFSMGGRQTLLIGLQNLDQFAYIGGLSTYARNLEDRIVELVGEDPDRMNAQIELLWLGCGRQDDFMSDNEALSELLKEQGIEHTFYPTGGLHIYDLWRRHLTVIVPKLFR